MVTVHNQHRTGAPPVGRVNQDAPVARFLNNALDRRGFRADDRHKAACRNHIAEADVNELHSVPLFT